MPISFVVGRDKYDQVGIKKDDKDKTVILTIKNTIELFIQRSFRMEKSIKDKFDFKTSKEYKNYKCRILENQLETTENL